MFSLHGNNRVWWKCKQCEHEWQSFPNHRSKGAGYPFCSGRVPIIGINDLIAINPILASEWNPTMNASLTPNMVFYAKAVKKFGSCIFNMDMSVK